MPSSVFTVKAEGGGGGGQGPDLAEVRRGLTLLADPEGGIQLQYAPFHAQSFRTFSGGDLDAACAWVGEVGKRAKGVYYALNPVPPDLGHSLRVADVLRRRWLLIDCDRNKALDPDESASEEEHELVRALALAVRDYLDGLGWPHPLLVDSGNGFHLLYRIDLPNDGVARVLLRMLLGALADKFNCERGAIGRECHDARRISKLPGTWARRGTHTAERPHRLCRIIHEPAALEVVSEELLRLVLPSAEAEGGETSSPAGRPDPFKVRAGDASSIAYARAAFERECGRLALTGRGGLNHQLYASGAAMGNFIALGLLDEEEVFQRLLEMGRAAGCNNPPKDISTLRRGIEAGKETPRVLPEGDGHSGAIPVAVPDEGAKSAQKPPPTIYRLPELLRLELPDPRWAVPGILAEGLTILAGKPKLGKSFWALNVALTVAAGGKALGDIQVEPGDVLYLALEDRLRRVQDRARKVLRGLNSEASDRLHIAVEWPRADQGGLDHLGSWLAKATRPVLVVVDVWARFRQPSKTNGNQYEHDYGQASILKALGDDHSCSVLAVHHSRKGAAEDVFDEISGTLGLAGGADSSLVLVRARGENEATLHVTGRDVDEQELALTFNPQTFTWTSHGDAGAANESRMRASLAQVFRANEGVVLTTTELADQVDCPEARRPYLRTLLARMAACDEIERVGPGRFRWRYNDTEVEE